MTGTTWRRACARPLVGAALAATVALAACGSSNSNAGYPLYTYSRDSGSGQANGQGIKSFGGTWWAISPSGALVTKTASSSGY